MTQYTFTPATAALYLNWAEYLSWHDPRIRSYDQFLMADRAQWRVRDRTPVRRTARRSPATRRSGCRSSAGDDRSAQGQALDVWGSVRPAHYAQLAHPPAPDRSRIQFQPASGGAFKTVSTVTITDRYGYFDVLQKFPGSGTVRPAWRIRTVLRSLAAR